MKPLKVEFSAFGSFPDKVSVDFENLRKRGLFLVTGDTGTGKTTIFDAISYALFGKMPMKDARDIRSHHAEADRRTWVRFTFQVGGITYRAERHPAQKRRTKRGVGLTEDNAGASLLSLNADGTTTPIASKSRDVSLKCAKLIGLDENQFQRVMLLAQGEVNRFLIDTSGDREQLLAALFGGDLYSRITDYLKEESSKLSQECQVFEMGLAHHLETARTHLCAILEGTEQSGYDLSDADRNEVEELYTASAEVREELARQTEAARNASNNAHQQLTTARDELKRFEQVERITSELTALDAKEESKRALTRSGEASRSARPIVEAHQSAKKAEEDASEAMSRLSEMRRQIDSLGESAGMTIDQSSALAISNSINTHRRMVEKDKELVALSNELTKGLHELENRSGEVASLIADEASKLADLKTQIASSEAELTQLQSNVRDQQTLDENVKHLEAALSTISDRDRLSGSVDDLSTTAQRLDEEHAELLRRFVATEAPRLALALREGARCPVCGSEEHPYPAESDDGEPIEFSQVEALKQTNFETVGQLEIKRGELQRLREELREHADERAEVIEELLESARSARDENRSRTQQAKEIEIRLNRLTTEQQAVERSLTVLETNLQSIEDTLKDTQENQRTASTNAAHIDAEVLSEKLRCIESLEKVAEHADQIFSAVTQTMGTMEERKRVFEGTIASSEFTTIDEAQAALMDQDSEVAAVQALGMWRSQKEKYEAELDAYRAQGVPETRPDMEALSRQAAEFEQQAQQFAARSATVSNAAENFVAALAEFDFKAEDSAKMRHEFDIARRAAIVCDGQSKTRINLQRWILGRELERVTAAATVHLRLMTGGRYGIQRVTEAEDNRKTFGLDLEVLDAHTGRPRSPKSLSGGEQFQASLALALGLADVVSQGGNGGGHRMEALFIDEGFGSLDPRALEEAIETLHQLQATGRMVGAITHVEIMKERLHPGIVVKRLPSGNGSTLEVYP